MSFPVHRNLVRVLALAAAFCFLYFATLWKLGFDWATDQNYSHGLLIPFVIGYIVWAEREALNKAVNRPRTIIGGMVIAFALLTLWAGTAGAELFVQRISLVAMIVGIVVYLWGSRVLKLLSVPLLLLVFSIPIPAIIFNKIAFPLQLFASRCAVAAMRLFSIPVLRLGNVIELKPINSAQTIKLEVVEACSGIRSLMTLLALALVLAYFTGPRNRDEDNSSGGLRFRAFRLIRSVLIVGAAVPIAIVTNALRVSGTGILAHYYGTRVADGFFHTFSGWVVYVVAFLMVFGTRWLVDRLGFRSKGDPPRGGNSVRDVGVRDRAAIQAAPVVLVSREVVD